MVQQTWFLTDSVVLNSFRRQKTAEVTEEAQKAAEIRGDSAVRWASLCPLWLKKRI